MLPRITLRLAAFAILFFSTANDAAADLKDTHKGVEIIGVKAAEEGKVEPGALNLKTGIRNIAKAIDVIYAKSPFSAAKLEVLKKNGQVVISYNPAYQSGKLGGFALASFFPDYYKRDSKNKGDKRFFVVIGPHAVKWPTDELAMIIVHELVGHGMQRLLGHLDYIRVLDLECAANLYGEKFYQDIGIDKNARDVVKFRKKLEKHWCSDFKTYMRKNAPSRMALWEVLNPDVPKLLDVFSVYVNALRKNGVAGKAIAAAKELRRQKLEKKTLKAETEGKAEDQYALGVIYFKRGKGAPKDYKEAVRLFRLAAEQGNIYAQARLGVMLITGHGAAKDNFLANFWLTLAKDGYPRGKNRDVISKAWKNTWEILTPKQRQRIGKLTNDWRRKQR
ncbi:MAG TPA: sel1 repeat family protein [Rhodospirillales bacterium]|nr:sel1 repeat family protein [Rhodospirillales bacterium]